MGGVRSAEAGVSFDAEMVVDLTGDEIVTGSKSTIDEPWELPEGWVWTTLGALGVWSGGGTPSKANSAFWANGTIPWVSPKDMKVDVIGVTEDRITQAAVVQSSTKLVPAGSVLMVMRSGILRHTFPVAVNEREVTLNQDLRALTPSVAIDPHFVARYLKLATHRILTECAKDGTTVDSIEAPALARLPVPIAPLAEQRRIVARIDELFAEIAEGEAALARARSGLETFRRALLKSAVTGELTREWREQAKYERTGSDIVSELRAKHPDEGATRRSWSPSATLPSIPDSWSWCAVSEAGDVQLGRQRAPQHHEGDHMRPYLRVANVLDDRLDLTDVKSMNFTPKEFETFALRYGDILLNEGQAPDLLGRPAMYRNEIPGCCFQKTLLRFRAKQGISPDYALLVFRYYMHSGRFKRESRITTNIGHLTQVRFVEMEFPVPPVEEQQEIVARFQALNAGEETLSPLPSDAARLRQAVLKAAFEGRLVPQDSNDEPAGVMLERLATEPTKVTPQRRGRPKRAER